eukprot:366278-Chlamydomonas_euryale.AAC.44
MQDNHGSRERSAYPGCCQANKKTVCQHICCCRCWITCSPSFPLSHKAKAYELGAVPHTCTNLYCKVPGGWGVDQEEDCCC